MRYATVLAGLAFMAGCAAAQDQADDALAGEVTDARPRVDFPLMLETGDIVTLTTSSDENFDTILTLTGPDGRVLAENDDMSPGTLQSQIVVQATATGRYTVSVTGYGGSTGAFELNIEEGVDFGLSSAARTVTEDIVALSASAPTERLTVDLVSDDILVATTFALTGGLDTVLSLTGPDGMVVSQNDDRGDGTLNSQIVFQADQAGRYMVEIGSFAGNETGDLVISLAIDPNAEVPFDFSSIEGQQFAEHSGRIGNDQPSRSYPVPLEEGQTLYAYADAISGDLDTLLRLSAPDGHPVAVNDDRGDGSLNSAIAYTALQSGTYTLEMSRYQGSQTSGEFALILSFVEPDIVDLLQELRERVITLSGEVQTLQTNDFLVHYTLEGDDELSREYAESVGIALQEIYDIQIGQMGWSEPIRDDDGLYRVFIADAGGSLGVAYPVEVVFDNPNTADVRETEAARAIFLVENDFLGLGKEASPHSLMRATATHEFNHIVQYGYDAEEELGWLYELTASWIETVTVGADQDATDYVETDFRSPHTCWTTTDGGFNYSQWTLLQSIADVHGNDMIVRFWESSVANEGFETMAAPLRQAGTSIPDVIQRWRAQNFARDYNLAPHFNVTVAPRASISDTGPWQSKGGLEQLGANYIELDLDGALEISIDGDDGLEVMAMGVTDENVDIVPLGRSGGIDTGAYNEMWLMVFNRAMPSAPGDCSGVGYSLDIRPMTGTVSPVAYRFDARHFEAPQETSEGDL